MRRLQALGEAMSLVYYVETIRWTAVTDALPDDNTTVLVYFAGASEPVWLGFYDDDDWFTIDSAPWVEGSVTAWAAMPHGPKP